MRKTENKKIFAFGPPAKIPSVQNLPKSGRPYKPSITTSCFKKEVLMGNIEYYDQLIEQIKAIPPDKIIEPNLPVDTAAQEAENTHDWALSDKTELVAANLDWSLVESLPARAGALRKAESNWFSERFAKGEASLKWDRESPGAYKLRDKLVHDMLFAYRKNDEIHARIQAIAEGTGHADMIQDLSDLSVIARKNPEQLKTIKQFDFKDIDIAEQFSSEMARMLAGAKATAGVTEAKIIRDKAFTYLKTALDEVRAVGQFVFWKRPDRLPGYSSQYFRRHNKKDSKKPATGSPA